MISKKIHLIKIAFALVSVCFIVQACQELQDRSYDLESRQRQILEWDIILEKNDGLRCFTFELETNGLIDRLFFEVTPREDKSTDLKFLMMFITNSMIQDEEELVHKKFLGNEYKDKIIASDLDGVFSKQYSSKIFYKLKEQGNKRYYVYLRYFIKDYFINIIHQHVRVKTKEDYKLRLVLNPKDTDLCKGSSTEQNECKCKKENKITQYCNVDVMYLQYRDTEEVLFFQQTQFRFGQMFFYLNHTQLYQNFSEETQFELKFSLKKKIDLKHYFRFYVFYKFLDKSNTNDQLPLLEAAQNYYKVKNNNPAFEYKFMIEKERNDQIFALYNTGNQREFELSLKRIEVKIKVENKNQIDKVQINSVEGKESQKESTNEGASSKIEGQNKQVTEDLWYKNSNFYLILAAVFLVIVLIPVIFYLKKKQKNEQENNNLVLPKN